MQDGIEPTKGDHDRRDSTGSVAKIIQNAKAATDKEQRMTLWEGIKTYPKAVGWSLLISTCIAMEGYDISLVNNFYAFDQFNRKYGELTANGDYQVPARVSFFFSFFYFFPSLSRTHLSIYMIWFP